MWALLADAQCFHTSQLDNMLLHGRGRRPMLRICDFGYSKDEMGQSMSKSTCGTPEYMAPEVGTIGAFRFHFSELLVGGVAAAAAARTLPLASAAADAMTSWFWPDLRAVGACACYVVADGFDFGAAAGAVRGQVRRQEGRRMELRGASLLPFSGPCPDPPVCLHASHAAANMLVTGNSLPVPPPMCLLLQSSARCHYTCRCHCSCC